MSDPWKEVRQADKFIGLTMSEINAHSFDLFLLLRLCWMDLLVQPIRAAFEAGTLRWVSPDAKGVK